MGKESGFKQKLSELFARLKGMWKTPPEGRYLTIKETGFFGLYALGNSFIANAAAYVVTVTYIPYFYGIDVLHAYLIMIVGNGLNLLLQPLLGGFMERTRSKIGRYKPYVLFSLPAFCLAAVASTWIPQFEIETSRIVYAYLTCVPLILLSTYANNMYSIMPNVITPNAQERADLMTPISLVVGFAPSVMNIIAGPIRSYFLGKGQEYMGLRIIGIVSVAIGIVCVLFILKVRERVYDVASDARKPREKFGFRKSFGLLIRNKPLWILFAALVLGSLREFWRTYMPLIVQLRFAENVSDALNVSGIPLTIIGFASTVSMLLLPIVTRKIDKHKAIVFFSLGNVLSMAILSIAGFQNIPVGIVSAVVITILFFIAGINPMWLLIPLMFGDIADYQQLKTGKRMEGHLQNLLFTIPAWLSQFAMLGAWLIQREIGFEPKDFVAGNVITDAQNAVANEWFRMTCIISLASTVFLIAVVWFYPLSKARHETIMRELKELAGQRDGESGFIDPVADEITADRSARNAPGDAEEFLNEDTSPDEISGDPDGKA